MADDELTDAARAEIAAAIKIVKEDRMYAKLSTLTPPTPPDIPKPDAPKPDAPKPDAPKPDVPKPDAPDAPKPPPQNPPNEIPKKKGLWWGDRIEDEPEPT